MTGHHDSPQGFDVPGTRWNGYPEPVPMLGQLIDGRSFVHILVVWPWAERYRIDTREPTVW